MLSPLSDVRQGSGFRLIHGDCLSRMRDIEAGSIQLVVADLPYGNGKTGCDWDIQIDLPTFWSEVRRILKPHGTIVAFGAQPFTTDLINSKRDWFRYELIWRKSRPTGFPHSRCRPLTDHENIVVFCPGNYASGDHNKPTRGTYNPQGLIELQTPLIRKSEHRVRYLGGSVLKGTTQTHTNFPRSVLEFQSVHKPEHPTQKPVELLRYLICTFSDPGDMVLDPTAGSGSTGEAALLEHREFVGIEMSAKFFHFAADRLAAAAAQRDLERCADCSEERQALVSESTDYNTGQQRVSKISLHSVPIHVEMPYTVSIQEPHRMARTFAYCRVSTGDQTTTNQIREIEAAGFNVEAKRVVAETVSGSVPAMQRDGFAKLVDRLESADVLIVTKLDRLGRNAMDVRATVEMLAHEGVKVHCLALGGVDLTSAAGKMTMGVISAVAEFERDLLIERTQSGLKRAKAEGKVLGRPMALSAIQQAAIRERRAQGVSLGTLAKEYGVSRAAIQRVQKRP